MSLPVIEIRKRKGGISGGANYYMIANTHDSGSFVNHVEIYELMKSGREIELGYCDEGMTFLDILKTVECGQYPDKTVKGDVAMMNRIIRNGGLVEYAKQLEIKGGIQ